MIFLVGVALFLFSTHQMDKVHSSNVETAYSAIGLLGIFAMGLSYEGFLERHNETHA